jgi:hypothetical protein
MPTNMYQVVLRMFEIFLQNCSDAALTLRFGVLYEELVLRWLDDLPWKSAANGS